MNENPANIAFALICQATCFCLHICMVQNFGNLKELYLQRLKERMVKQFRYEIGFALKL